jgi:hypothetical protein
MLQTTGRRGDQASDLTDDVDDADEEIDGTVHYVAFEQPAHITNLPISDAEVPETLHFDEKHDQRWRSLR